MSERSRDRLLVLGLMVAALLMSLKYFPGLENEAAYAGNAYQIIHPDAFAGDPYRGPETPVWKRPLQLSAMYALVKAVGELWLDDRFLFLVYWGLVAVGLAGIDRTARLLGVSGPVERLTVLLMFLKDHQLLDHKVLLAHHADVNHTAFAIPIIVWLIYAALAGKRLWIVLALAALLSVTSIRNALFPILFSLAVVAANGSRRERLAVAGLCLFGALAAYWAVFHGFAVPEETRLQLWELIHREEEGDANPFQPSGPLFPLQVAMWFLICGAAYLVSPGKAQAFRGVRVIMLTAVVVFVAGGVYITYAPDALKQPLLIGFAPNRALAWPQNLAYVAILAAVFRRLGVTGSGREAVLACLTVALLFVAGPGNLGKWTALVALSAAAVLALHGVGRPAALTARGAGIPFVRHLETNWPLIACQTLFASLAVAFAVMLSANAPALGTFVRTGVWPHNPSAVWIGVAEYVRENTPKTATILPLTNRLPESHGALKATRSLATRTGRAIPVPEAYSPDFRNVRSWEFAEEQAAVLERIETAFQKGDYRAAAGTVERLVPVPDYIVLPKGVLRGPSADLPSYVREMDIRGYTVFRRQQ